MNLHCILLIDNLKRMHFKLIVLLSLLVCFVWWVIVVNHFRCLWKKNGLWREEESIGSSTVIAVLKSPLWEKEDSRHGGKQNQLWTDRCCHYEEVEQHYIQVIWSDDYIMVNSINGWMLTFFKIQFNHITNFVPNIIKL